MRGSQGASGREATFVTAQVPVMLSVYDVRGEPSERDETLWNLKVHGGSYGVFLPKVSHCP
jgi:hypothetical protein